MRSSHPEWVVDELDRALGRPEELDALLAADNERPLVTLVARPGLSTVAELSSAGVSTGSTTVSPLAVVLESGDPGAIPAVREGRAGVQDAGSQLVALALTRASVEGRDERWLDLCAGPGGKAALLAALATQQGARLLANERQPHRARLVAQALRATVGDVVAGDGTRPAWPDDTFDRVLVDAPCSGLGALRRRPESRWRRRPEDLEDLVPLQRALLDGAVDSVRPGGVVRLRDLLARGRGDGGRGRGGAGRAERRTRGGPGAAACPRRSTRSRPSSQVRSSSGRTGTAPTRCSWRCSARSTTGHESGARAPNARTPQLQ